MTPLDVGRLDNLATAYHLRDNFGIFLQTYFVAPQTGNYIFYSSCDDQARIYLSTNENESQKQKIIDQSSYIGNYLE